MTFSLLKEFLDPQLIISSLGALGVLIVIFLETGFFFGFFFPGDSLLFTAGLLASQGLIPVWWLIIGAPIMAIIGDSVGYAFGKKVGPALFTKEDSFFFDKKYIERSQHFYEKYGKKTIFLARFIPIVRTFAPIVAGVGDMEYKIFISYNIFGGLIWTWLMIGLGYWFGAIVPNPDLYILPIVAIIIIISIIPPVWEVIRRHKTISTKS